MNKFNNYRAITRFAGFVIVLIAALLVSPSIRPQDEQCEVLKKRIINPKNNYEKNHRYYYCEQMKDRNCPDYKSLCEDSNDKGDNVTKKETTPDISGSWTSNINVSYGISQEDAMAEDSSAFTWTAPKLHSKGEGKLKGNGISAKWTGDWGPGSATGTIKLDANGRATRIDWSNGVVFTRE